MAAARRCCASATATKFADSAASWLASSERSREALDFAHNFCATERRAGTKHRVPARSRLACAPGSCGETQSLGLQTRSRSGRQEALPAKLRGMSWSGWLWPGEKACRRLAASGRAESKGRPLVFEDKHRKSEWSTAFFSEVPGHQT